MSTVSIPVKDGLFNFAKNVLNENVNFLLNTRMNVLSFVSNILLVKPLLIVLVVFSESGLLRQKSDCLHVEFEGNEMATRPLREGKQIRTLFNRNHFGNLDKIIAGRKFAGISKTFRNY